MWGDFRANSGRVGFRVEKWLTLANQRVKSRVEQIDPALLGSMRTRETRQGCGSRKWTTVRNK